jgi:enoyl-CoA hydratase/carnithine racemase
MVEARRAEAAGAVLAVVPAERLEAETWSVIAGILDAAPLTISVTKEQLRDGAVGYDAAVDDARLERAYGSADFREGVRSFLAKEKPAFGAQPG